MQCAVCVAANCVQMYNYKRCPTLQPPASNCGWACSLQAAGRWQRGGGEGMCSEPPSAAHCFMNPSSNNTNNAVLYRRRWHSKAPLLTIRNTHCSPGRSLLLLVLLLAHGIKPSLNNTVAAESPPSASPGAAVRSGSLEARDTSRCRAHTEQLDRRQWAEAVLLCNPRQATELHKVIKKAA